MNKIAACALHFLILAAPWVFASPAVSAPRSGIAVFVGEGRIYQGKYAVKNQAISVDIDGLIYRGNYAANSKEEAAMPGAPSVGSWGRAFLFASSAKVLQCQLDSGFPRVSGRCQSADGQNFDLKHAMPGKTSRPGLASKGPSS